MNRITSTSARTGSFGVLACAVITCVVAPPVRGASGASDGGGCNGGRSFAADEGTGEASTGAESSSGTGGSEATTMVVEGRCGDGVQDEGEGCDDGNEVDEDACPSGALGTCEAARCGDGVVWAGKEACDGAEGCTAACEWMAECGNGMVEAGEGCDDGNTEDEDGCPSGAGGCVAAAGCGDGFVWAGMEVCDDGNVSDEDGCPSGEGGCVAVAGCGDGFVEAGVEGCDDGNGEETDACPSGAAGACKAAAVCGDGFVEAGVEGCDDGNGEDLDGCSNACATPRWVFVTSDLITGNLGGIVGADAYCQGLASAASLGGTYKAWLTDSDPKSAPAMRFGSEGFTGWYRLNTNPPTGVAEGWTDLVGGNRDVPGNYLQNGITINEQGVDVGSGSAWTNTRADGMQQSSEQHCKNWTESDDMLNGTIGRVKAGVLDKTWTDYNAAACSFGVRLYCFQTG